MKNSFSPLRKFQFAQKNHRELDSLGSGFLEACRKIQVPMLVRHKIIELTRVEIWDQIKSTDSKSIEDAEAGLVMLSEDNKRTVMVI